MSKSAGNAVDLITRSLSSLERRFSFARLQTLVSMNQVDKHQHYITYFGTRLVPDEHLGRGLLLTDGRAVPHLDELEGQTPGRESEFERGSTFADKNRHNGSID